MIHLVPIEDVKPGMKMHIMGRVLVVHTPPHFWLADNQGTGFVCARDDSQKSAEAVIVYKNEQIAVE